MNTYVFDASGLIRYIEHEAGTDRVQQLLDEVLFGLAAGLVSAVNWGEARHSLAKRYGVADADQSLQLLLEFGIRVVEVTTLRAERAALIKLQYRIPYADCFGVELTQDSPHHILITADFDSKPAENAIRIEFLPPKPKPAP